MKSWKVLALSLPWCRMGYLLPSCSKTVRPSLEGEVILVRLYVVNSEKASEVVVCKENEDSSGGETCR